MAQHAEPSASLSSSPELEKSKTTPCPSSPQPCSPPASSSSDSKRALSEKQTSRGKSTQPQEMLSRHPELEDLLSDLFDKDEEEEEKDRQPQDLSHLPQPPVNVPLYIALHDADSNYHSSFQLACHITIRPTTTLLDLQDAIEQELRVLRLLYLPLFTPMSFLWTTTYGKQPIDSCTWESRIPRQSLKWRILEQYAPEQPACLKESLRVECHSMTERQFQKLWKRENMYEEKYGQYHWRTMGWRDGVLENGFHVGNWEGEEELRWQIKKAMDRKGGLMAYLDWRKEQVYDDD